MERKFDTAHLKAKKPEAKKDDKLITALKNCLRADTGNNDLDDSGTKTVKRLLAELTRDSECSIPPKVTRTTPDGVVDIVSNTRNRCFAFSNGNIEITVLVGNLDRQIVEVYYSPMNIFTKVTDAQGQNYEIISITSNQLSFQVLNHKGGKQKFFLKTS
jgi:hypothetical protein